MPKKIVIIPARLDSQRLPKKIIRKIGGIPLILHTLENANSFVRDGLIDEVYVATDSESIANIVRTARGNAILTGKCDNGTERVAAALSQLSGHDDDIIINIQGDEPRFSKKNLTTLLDIFDAKFSIKSQPTRLRKATNFTSQSTDTDQQEAIKKIDARFQRVDISTLAIRIDEREAKSTDNVKVVFGAYNNALYFSRAIIPHLRDKTPQPQASPPAYYRHIGVYGYSRKFLLKEIQVYKKSPLEEIEKIEQLRFLASGAFIKIGIVTDSGIDINNAQDVTRFERLLAKENPSF